MIEQITVFLENREGRLAKMCRCIAEAGVNMSALTIADTSEYGVVRIICDDPAKAAEALEAGGWQGAALCALLGGDTSPISLTDSTTLERFVPSFACHCS